MSGHYVLIHGVVRKIYGCTYLATIYASVFLATVRSFSFRVSLTFGDITISLTHIVGARGANISGPNSEQ